MLDQSLRKTTGRRTSGRLVRSALACLAEYRAGRAIDPVPNMAQEESRPMGGFLRDLSRSEVCLVAGGSQHPILAIG